MISIKNVIHKFAIWDDDDNKSYKTALDGISMDIPSGQFMTILGPNGSGKSTMAKHLNVLLLPDEGTIWIDGKDTSDAAFLAEIRQNVGMVFQNPDNQIIGTSVEEDVAFGPENKCMESSRIQHVVAECLHRVGLSEKRKQSPTKLSGGQKQRLAIASALAGQPTCIVLDEPTAMLDPNSRKEVLDVVHRLNRELGMTVILITHHMEEAVDSDRIVLMKQGKIAATGSPEEIFDDIELLRDVRMDIPQVTELAYRLKRDGVDIKTPVLHEEELIDELARLYREAGGSDA